MDSIPPSLPSITYRLLTAVQKETDLDVRGRQNSMVTKQYNMDGGEGHSYIASRRKKTRNMRHLWNTALQSVSQRD